MARVYGKYGQFRSRPRAWFDLLVLACAWSITLLPPAVDRWMVRATMFAYRTVLRRKVRHVADKMRRLIGPGAPAGHTWEQVALAYWEMRSESHWMRVRAIHRAEQPVQIRLEGLHHLETALDEGRGVILWRMFFCSSHIPKRALAEAGYPMVHLSHWDHGSRGLSFAGLRLFAPLWVRAEVRYLLERVVLPRDESLDYLRRLMYHLDRNHVLSIFGNIRGDRAPQQIEVLGTKRLLATGAPSLARRTGAALLTMRARREGPCRFVVTIDGPIGADRGLPRAQYVEAAVGEYAARVERAVRDAPESWFRWPIYIDHR